MRLADQPDITPTDSRRPSLAPAILAVSSLVVAIGYALVTNHVWEDFLITFRHSRNLVEGNGLVYTPGERLHGFTSPINVLLPALFYWLSDQSSYVPALWGYRIVSALAFAAVGFVLVKWMAARNGVGSSAVIFFGVYFLLEFKSVSYSMNGQEAAFLLLFLGLGLIGAVEGAAARWVLAGSAWGGLMWTRPDGCVYVAGLALAALLAARSKKDELRGILKAGVLGATLYLPWFVWAWVYYGSPVPFPALVKASRPEAYSDLAFLVAGTILAFPTAIQRVLAPTYWQFGGWPTWIGSFGLLTGLIAGLYWALPTRDAIGRAASVVFALSCGYLAYVRHTSYLFPWYLPPAGLCAVIVLSRAPVMVAQLVARSKIGLRWERAAVGAALGFQGLVAASMLYMFAASTLQMKVQQEVIEFGNRAEIGLWLSDHVGHKETIFLEPVGYIGYYSNGNMLDYPGIVSPAVARISGSHSMEEAIESLEPDWLVLRPHEVANLQRAEEVYREYRLEKPFDVRRELDDHNLFPGLTTSLDSYQFLPGRAYLEFDATFLIYRRRQGGSL